MITTVASPRYRTSLPAAPLITYARRLARNQGYDIDDPRRDTHPLDNDVRTARVLGVSTRQVMRWKQPGVGIRIHQADRICIQVLGIHPAEIWGDDYWSLNG